METVFRKIRRPDYPHPVGSVGAVDGDSGRTLLGAGGEGADGVLNTVNDDILVKVIRDEHIQEVPRKDVVVGDIVVLGTGEEIPADGHLLEAVSLQVNESTLTGEPVIGKTTNEAEFDADATYPSNVVMRGTTVVDGHGVMEVEKVGDATGYGKVYEGSQIDNNIDTPLQIQLSMPDILNAPNNHAASKTLSDFLRAVQCR